MKTAVRKSETPRRRSAPRGNERRLVTQHPRRRILSLAAGAAALPVVSRIARAQAYPTRPVRILVGNAPGGAHDLMARMIGPWLSQRLGQPFIIENRPGASGSIATESVVRAPADGYTLLVVGSSSVINATLNKKLNYNFIRDIAPVASIISTPFAMTVHPSVPANTVPEFIAYAKTNPAKINFASSGIGLSDHLCGELFKIMTGVDMVHLPYRGGGPALADLLGGQVQMMFVTLAVAIEHIRSGRLRPIGVTTATRLEVLPNVPAVAEFVAGFEGIGFVGIGAPRSTPFEVIERLNKEINAFLASSVKERITDMGAIVQVGSPAEFGKFIASETEKWGNVIRTNNIQPE
jgi:tripartite-type tricarboxylate transporter receptor subunit TctC